jgi:Asp/Glu/hydantoin racemase
MRILWQSFVDRAGNAPYFERLSAYLNEIAAPGTKVKLRGTSPPDRDFGRLTEFRCAALAIDSALAAEDEGFDVFVFGHFQDPGLYEARSALRIPVVGVGEATLHLAAQLGRRIGLVSIDPVFAVWHLEQAERYGLRDRVVGVAGMGAIPEDFSAAFAGDGAALARLKAAFMAGAEPLVALGADVIVPAGCPGCCSPARRASPSGMRRWSIAPPSASRRPRWWRSSMSSTASNRAAGRASPWRRRGRERIFARSSRKGGRVTARECRARRAGLQDGTSATRR